MFFELEIYSFNKKNDNLKNGFNEILKVFQVQNLPTIFNRFIV